MNEYCENCPRYMDDCDGADAVGVCTNPLSPLCMEDMEKGGDAYGE